MGNNNLIDIVSHFAIQGTVSEIEPLGNGLINTTYKVSTTEPDCPDYVLQHINNAVFPDVEMLMNNILAVTSHIRNKLEKVGTVDINRKVLSFIPVEKTGKYYLQDGNDYWRMMKFIPRSITRSDVTPETSYDVGRTFGNFQSMLTDIPVTLDETIKDFHNMEFRLQQLRDAISEDRAGRVGEVRYYINEIERRADAMCEGERLYRDGILPKRICHCDTKVDNMMFDQDGSILCVIDLDTVMPNFIFSDFGDFLRSAANTGDEDDEDLDRVNFNLEIFKAFTKGYLETAGKFLTRVEIEHLPYAAALFPYMQTVRFLTDYINGDTYYKTTRPHHNLIRTKAQFKLLQSVEQQRSEMIEFINTCL